MPAPLNNIKVLFITGAARSGSTILDRILGQVDGFFSLGEVRNIPEHILLLNWKCGCGLNLRECEIWSAVFTQAFGGFDHLDAGRYIHLREYYTRPRRMLYMALGTDRRLIQQGAQEYSQMLDALYSALHTVTGAKVLIDSSKFPAHAHLYSVLGKHRSYALHLIRDARAVTHSWRRKRTLIDSPDQRQMKIFSPLKSMQYWTLYNIGAEILPRRSKQPYMSLRYEDLILSPREHLNRILGFVGVEQAGLPLVDETTVYLGEDHTMGGNPNRMQSGKIELREDLEWKSAATFSTRFWSLLLGWPQLLRYGYKI